MQNANTQHQKRFPWLMVSLGIAGLLIGYAAVIGKQGIVNAASNGYSCPAKQLCKGNDCNQNPSCKGTGCSKDCPGNCGHPV